MAAVDRLALGGGGELVLKKEAALALKAITTLRAKAKARAQACEWRRATLPETSLIFDLCVQTSSPWGGHLPHNTQGIESPQQKKRIASASK